MTVGDRLSNGTYTEENKRAFHGFGNNLVRAMIKWIYGYSFEDVMTGYRAMGQPFVKTFPVLSEGFQIETELSIHAVDHEVTACVDVAEHLTAHVALSLARFESHRGAVLQGNLGRPIG